MPRGGFRSGPFWPPSTPAVTGPIEEATLRAYAIYYDLFDEVLSGGNVDGTDSTDENALREVYDTASKTNLDGDDMQMVPTGAGDPSLWHTTLAPGPWTIWNGYAIYMKLNTGTDPTMEWGLDEDQAAGITSPRIKIEPAIFNNWVLSVLDDGLLLFMHPASDDMSLMISRRYDSEGYLYFYRTTENWRLFWMDEGPLKKV